MPKGTPLTPEQIGRAAEVHARTGSYSEAARAIGAPDPSTVRKALLRLGNPNRSQLHARALQEGSEAGRVALVRTLDGLDAEQRRLTRVTRQRRARVTASDKPEDVKLAALARLSRERIAALVSAAKGLNLAVGRLESLADQCLNAQQKKLTREKTRAEIDALRKGTVLTTEQLLAYLAALPREELLGLIATLRAHREAAGAPSSPSPPSPSPPASPGGA